MSLKRNIIANYISYLYVAAIGILVLPLYIKYMGSEAYGLVGFFTTLQAWFVLLDIGLTPTIGRETARYYGGRISPLEFRQLFRALSSIFLFIALTGGISLWLFAEPVAKHWLNVVQLDMSEVVLAVQIMAISVALRWFGGLYRGVITGAEQLLWLSGFNIIIATIRFVGVFVSMGMYGFTPYVFFLHQLIVSLAEVIGLLWKCYQLLPPTKSIVSPIGWTIKPVIPILKFSLTIAFTSSVWIFVTQTDKLILSGVLPLAEYGYFTLAVLVASGIMIISAPISNAIMPRMARLHAEGNHQELIQIYRNATQIVSIITATATLVIVFFTEPLIYAWTGSLEIAAHSAPILRLYAAGNGFLALAAFPYYLQYAVGNLRYHLIGNLILFFILIPAIFLAANHYGGIGAGYVWLIMNGLYFITWTAYIHHKLEPGLHRKWILKDCLIIYIPTATILLPAAGWQAQDASRWTIFLCLCGFTFAALIIASFSAEIIRNIITEKLRKFFYGIC